VGQGLLQLPPGRQGVAEVAVGLGEVGLEPDRCTEFGDRLIRHSPGCRDEAEVVMGQGEVGLEPDRLAVSADCPLAVR
jgi:hypothetical protein